MHIYNMLLNCKIFKDNTVQINKQSHYVSVDSLMMYRNVDGFYNKLLLTL